MTKTHKTKNHKKTKTQTRIKPKKAKHFCFAFSINIIKNYTFISTSTPLGNSSFIKASIVLDEDE
jgi:hypothetical protein